MGRKKQDQAPPVEGAPLNKVASEKAKQKPSQPSRPGPPTE